MGVSDGDSTSPVPAGARRHFGSRDEPDPRRRIHDGTKVVSPPVLAATGDSASAAACRVEVADWRLTEAAVAPASTAAVVVPTAMLKMTARENDMLLLRKRR